LNFLVDNQLPPALARQIQGELGHHAAHVSDLGMRNASDVELWTYASEHDCVLISKDEDFTNMVLRTSGAGLIWVRVGNCRRAFLLNLFRDVWPRVLERLEAGDRFVEIR
jgi:predicted nuclease of predicted toxin-antitoxin system